MTSVGPGAGLYKVAKGFSPMFQSKTNVVFTTSTDELLVIIVPKPSDPVERKVVTVVTVTTPTVTEVLNSCHHSSLIVSCTTKQHAALLLDGARAPGDAELGAESNLLEVNVEESVVDVEFGRERDTAVVSDRRRDDYIDALRISVPLGIGEGRA